jgi:septal ring factor EnvC (AmiA/AmiB activator)
LIQTYVDDNINKLIEQINHIEEQLQEFNTISETLKLNEYQHDELYNKLKEFEIQLSTIMKEILSIVKQLSLKQVEVSEQQTKLEIQKFKYIISLIT